MNCRMISNWRSCGIVNREDTDYSRAYGAIKKQSTDGLVCLGAGYGDTWLVWGYRLPSTNNVLAKIEALNFDEQISMFGQLLATWAIAT